MSQQLVLFSTTSNQWRLPQEYLPAAPERLAVERIVLCRGSLSNSGREDFVRRICGVYPNTRIQEQLDTPHNRLDLEEPDPAKRVAAGKRTLVFGEIHPPNAVWDGREKEPNYRDRRRLSLYGFCFYDCRFCYLAGRDAVWFSPTLKIFVNLAEILDEADRQARAATHAIEFCAGELQDGLALDPLTAYSTVLIPFFAEHRHAQLEIRTKSTDVDRLLAIEHGGHTALSWTLNPPEIARRYEHNAPPVNERIEAMRRCANAGYRIRASLMPVIPDGDWRNSYLSFVRDLLEHVSIERLTLGGISIDVRTQLLLDRRLGSDNAISRNLSVLPSESRPQTHYPSSLCRGLFRQIRDVARSIQPGLIVQVAIP